MATLQKFTTNLWFDGRAEEAAKFYTSIFENSKIGRIARYGNVGQEYHHQEAGTVLTVEFELNGNQFLALNGGPDFKFNEAISFIVHCEKQEEIDYYWEKLKDGGDPNAQQCGWLKDKFGVSWQIVPAKMNDWITGDQETSDRVMTALLKMKKLDISVLEQAAEKEPA